MRKAATERGARIFVELQSLYRLISKVRKFFNEFRKTGSRVDIDIYRETQRLYKREIVRARQEDWEDHCASIRDDSRAPKLHRVLGSTRETRTQFWVGGSSCPMESCSHGREEP